MKTTSSCNPERQIDLRSMVILHSGRRGANIGESDLPDSEVDKTARVDCH